MEDVYPDNNPEETERLIKKLKHVPLENIGCPEWLIQRGIIEELNLQSSFCLLQHQEEYVKELILSNDKMKHLIYELIHTEYWIDNVYKIIHNILTPNNTIFSLYMVLYYETTLTNLLQVLMFHSEAVMQSKDYLIDIVDFVGRKMNWMVGVQDHEHEMYAEDKFGDNEFDMNKHHFRIQFGTCIKSISLLRYIVEQMNNLSMGVRAHILNTHDMTMTITEVLLRKSWYRTDSKGVKYAFIENNWVKIEDLQDPDRMSKTDGQLWVCLYRLLLDKENQSVYEITGQRQASLFRLQSLLADPKLDQMSLIADIRRYLDTLRLFRPRHTTMTNYVIEKHAVIRNQLIEKYPEMGFKALAKKSLEDYFSPNGEELIEQAKSLSSHFDILATYTEASETMLGKKCNGHLTSKLSSSSVSESPAKLVAPPCKKCRGPGATKRCSTCKQAWYCRRQCQVDDWPTHQRHCRPATEQQAVENCKAGYGEAGSMALKRSPPPPPPPAAAAPKKSFDC